MREASRRESLVEVIDAVVIIERQIKIASSQAEQLIALTSLEVLLMQYIDQNPGATSSHIASVLGLRTSNASAALSDLEEKGLVERRNDPADGRSINVWPTKLAQSNLAQIHDHWLQMLSELNVSDKDLATTITTLNAIATALQ